MKKSKNFVLFASLISFIFLPCVFAESSCSYETQLELQKEATNVQANYETGEFGTGEIVESETVDEDGNFIMTEIMENKVIVSIYNITENIYVEVRDKTTGEVQTYNASDLKDGKISWDRENLDDIVEYEIKVFSNHPDCLGEELQKMNLVTPAYNYHSFQPYCQDVDAYYCQEYITVPLNLSDEEIEEMGYNEQLKKTEENKEDEDDSNNFQKSWIYILVGVILMIGVTSVVLVLIKKQRSKVL